MAMNLITRAIQFAHGGTTLLEWTITGNVVDQSHAQGRADICTGRLTGDPCPNNQKGLKLIESISAGAKKIFELKKNLKLKVKGEKLLGTCSACSCPLPTLVWLEPNMTSPDEHERPQLAARCWKIIEHP